VLKGGAMPLGVFEKFINELGQAQK